MLLVTIKCPEFEEPPSVQAEGLLSFKFQDLEYLKVLARENQVECNPLLAAVVQNNLGVIAYKNNDHATALQYFSRALALTKERNIYYSRICNNIGLTYEFLGLYLTALDYLDEALEISLRFLPESDDFLATLYANKGIILDSIGEYSEALFFLRKALNIRLLSLGENNFQVMSNYNNLAVVLENLGSYDEGVLCMKRAIKISKMIKTEPSIEQALLYLNLGSFYHDQGKLPKFEEMISAAYTIFSKLNNNELVMAIYKNNKGFGSYWENISFAKSMISKARDIILKNFGNDHPLVAKVYNHLSIVHTAESEIAQAETLLHQAERIGLKYFRPNQLDLAKIYHNLGFTVKDQPGKEQIAIDAYKKCLEIYNFHFEDNHPSISIIYHNIAYIYWRLKQFKNAIMNYMRALGIKYRVLRKNDYFDSLTYRNIAMILAEKNNLSDAVKLYSKTIIIGSKAYGKSNHHVASDFNIMKNICEDIERSDLHLPNTV